MIWALYHGLCIGLFFAGIYMPIAFIRYMGKATEWPLKLSLLSKSIRAILKSWKAGGRINDTPNSGLLWNTSERKSQTVPTWLDGIASAVLNRFR